MVCSTIEFNYTMLHRTTPHASECTCIMYMCSKCIVHNLTMRYTINYTVAQLFHWLPKQNKQNDEHTQ